MIRTIWVIWRIMRHCKASLAILGKVVVARKRNLLIYNFFSPLFSCPKLNKQKNSWKSNSVKFDSLVMRSDLTTSLSLLCHSPYMNNKWILAIGTKKFPIQEGHGKVHLSVCTTEWFLCRVIIALVEEGQGEPAPGMVVPSSFWVTPLS
jgi:hypothetical protein